MSYSYLNNWREAMAYEVTNKLLGTTKVLTEQEAEHEFGAVDFTMMVAGIHDTHTAVNLSVETDTDGFDGSLYDDDTCDISEAFA